MDESAPIMPLHAGDVDWATNWRTIVTARRQVIESLGDSGEQRDFWDRRAGRFARMSRELDPSTDPVLALLRAALEPGGSVLDVGAGTGRYALPLAEIATTVTAVEPSAAMRSYLAAEGERRGLRTLQIVPATWEAAVVAPHDIGLAAHVLYPIAEVVPFLQKLDAHARRACFVVTRVDTMLPQLAPLWHAIWGQERPREPAFLDLYNLLFALGFRAEVRLVPFGRALQFDTRDDAISHVRQLLFLPDVADEHTARILGFLETTLIAQDGHLLLPNATQAAVVSWSSRGSSPEVQHSS
ncbi:MAG: hypothetical protein NVS2B7_36600 [Herpetosiphon sp.]